MWPPTICTVSHRCWKQSRKWRMRGEMESWISIWERVPMRPVIWAVLPWEAGASSAPLLSAGAGAGAGAAVEPPHPATPKDATSRASVARRAKNPPPAPPARGRGDAIIDDAVTPDRRSAVAPSRLREWVGGREPLARRARVIDNSYARRAWAAMTMRMDLARALVDLGDARVAVVALDGRTPWSSRSRRGSAGPCA